MRRGGKIECFDKDRATTGNIMGGYGSQFREEGRVKYELKPTDDDFHTFGMHWTPERYVFYCDGEVVSTAEKDVSQVPQFIFLTTEIQVYRYEDKSKIKTIEKFEDDAFSVDYRSRIIRVSFATRKNSHSCIVMTSTWL